MKPDDLVTDHIELKIPRWIYLDRDTLTATELRAIAEGGCASGAYTPAVTYVSATATLARHGDEIAEYLADRDCECDLRLERDWSMFCRAVVSQAVEAWAAETLAALDDLE